jgi:hypothetical protein
MIPKNKFAVRYAVMARRANPSPRAEAVSRRPRVRLEPVLLLQEVGLLGEDAVADRVELEARETSLDLALPRDAADVGRVGLLRNT